VQPEKEQAKPGDQGRDDFGHGGCNPDCRHEWFEQPSSYVSPSDDPIHDSGRTIISVTSEHIVPAQK
jgi:hypothetical protein